MVIIRLSQVGLKDEFLKLSIQYFQSFYFKHQKGNAKGQLKLVQGFAANISVQKEIQGGFPGGAVVKNPPANAGDTGSSPGPRSSHMPWSN